MGVGLENNIDKMGQFDPKDSEGSHPVHKDVSAGPGVMSSTPSQPVKYGELLVLG